MNFEVTTFRSIFDSSALDTDHFRILNEAYLLKLANCWWWAQIMRFYSIKIAPWNICDGFTVNWSWILESEESR